jgi:hypothetical protein
VRHVKAVLEASPRSVGLRRVQQALQARLAEETPAGESLRALYGLLRCPPAATAVDLLDARAARLLDRGKACRRWEGHRRLAAAGGKLDGQRLERIRAGKRSALLKGGKVRAVRVGAVEAELDLFMADLAAGRQKQAEDAAAAAEALWTAVEADPTYQEWARLGELWAASGAAELCAGALEAEKEEGDGRRGRGGAFEARAGRRCVAMVAQLLLGYSGRPRHWHAEGFAAVAGAEW